MSATTRYICRKCGKTVELAAQDTVPVCCDREMTVDRDLPVCESAPGGEHARFDADDGPCDDGRAG